MTPGKLAKELGTSKYEMFHALQDCGINLVRMSAHLSASQEAKLRAHWQNKRAASTRHIIKARTRVSQEPANIAGAPPRDFPRKCPCCERRWIHRGVADTASTVCSSCDSHRSVAGEDVQRQLARAESHAALYLKDRESAYEAFAKARSERQVVRESRRKWQAALVEVLFVII